LELATGSTYSQNASEFHRVSPATEFLATFCLQRPLNARTAEMFSRKQWKGVRVDFENWSDQARFSRQMCRSLSDIEDD
jgi:hypothetical protein